MSAHYLIDVEITTLLPALQPIAGVLWCDIVAQQQCYQLPQKRAHREFQPANEDL